MPDVPALSQQAREVLRLLKDQHNVLISGAPGTGKTRLLAEVSRAFESPPQAAAVPPYRRTGVLLPAAALPGEDWLPSPDRTRRVFPTVFDQKTKYRDFVRGLVPSVAAAGEEAGVRFRVSSGTLYRASEHARSGTGASLVTIDEINRGPAVQVFGDTIVAIESDKRLGSDGERLFSTQQFEVMGDDGEAKLYELPHHLYLLGAMNQADTSVEPLDVAFQRRWAPYHLVPDPVVLLKHFGLDASAEPETVGGSTGDNGLPEGPVSAADVYRAATRAWLQVNRRIALGRGRDFQLGHGVFMAPAPPPPDAAPGAALDYVSRGWAKVRAHVDEVFFGDTRAIAAALNVQDNPEHPYKLTSEAFAGERMLQLQEAPLTGTDLYRLLRAVGAR
ncbi:MAG TPA: AAA family ATPase [Longimicrobium sp.]